MSGTEIALALAKVLPIEKVYDDLAAPAVRQVGQTLESIVKCIRLATFPIEVGSASFDQLQRFIKRAVEEVEEENRIPPPPQILGPALEGIRYEEEGSPLEEMFAQLLSRSMDRTRVDEAHPAFPALIKQLSYDEAEIIRIIRNASLKAASFKRVSRHFMREHRFYRTEIEQDDFPLQTLIYPKNSDFYINHLSSLGIAGLPREDTEAIFDGGRQIASRETYVYRFTDLGERFASAVLKKRSSSSQSDASPSGS